MRQPPEGTDSIKSFGRRLDPRDQKLISQVLESYKYTPPGNSARVKGLALAQMPITERAFWGLSTGVKRRKKPHYQVRRPHGNTKGV